MSINIFPFVHISSISSPCRTVAKDSMIQSKQMGRRENKKFNMEGRVIFDLLLVSSVTLALLLNDLIGLLNRYCCETTNSGLTPSTQSVFTSWGNKKKMCTIPLLQTFRMETTKAGEGKYCLLL
jgi:hypothetical protein